MREKPGLIVNDDASTFLFAADWLSIDDLRSYLTSKYAESNVDMVAYAVAFGAGNCYYKTGKFTRFMSGADCLHDFMAHRVNNNYLAFDNAGDDYIAAVFRILEELGVKRLASIRMNDCHVSHQGSAFAGGFWQSHPEYRLGENCESEYYSAALDYAEQAVREFFLSQIEEVITMFPDIDGIELDFMRSPFCFKLHERQNGLEIMTDFIRFVRRLLDASGNHYFLTVNLPASPTFCRACGFDAVLWAKEGLIDLIASGFYLADMQVPMELWRTALPKDFPLYCYTNCSQQMGNYLSLENYRAVAANTAYYGGDGLYLFNFCCFDELSLMMPKHPDDAVFPVPAFPAAGYLPDLDSSRLALKELGNPLKLSSNRKHFQFYMSEQYNPHYPSGLQVLSRLEQSRIVTFRCCDEFSGSESVTLEFIISGITLKDEFEFLLNGEAFIPERLHFYRGRDSRLKPEKILPYSRFTAALPKKFFKNGENCLLIQVKATEPGLDLPIEFRELEIIIK